MPFSANHLSTILDQSATKAARLWIAYSGGVDSHVLLHRCHELQEELPSIAGAIHINHGLDENANQWSAHCQKTCRELGIEYHVSHIELATGEGLEDRARRARYTAFQEYLQPGDALLFAQHQDDQAETFLLQALRGGGPRGLASMPNIAPLGCGNQVRPLLETTRYQILDYADQQQLHWIEDESNQDVKFGRNFIRHKVMPILKQRWPSADRTLARSASHTASLVEIADELLRDELQDINGSRENTLSVTGLKAQPVSRAALLIRAMCQKLSLPVPNTVHINELLEKQLHAEIDRQIYITWPGAEIRRFQDDLYILAPRYQPQINQNPWRYDWDGTELLEIPECYGSLQLEPCIGEGIHQHFLSSDLNVRSRRGGERCQPCGDNHHRELKTIFQNYHIPPWERERLPLIYSGDDLIAIADITVCQDASVAENEAGYKVIWQSTD